MENAVESKSESRSCSSAALAAASAVGRRTHAHTSPPVTPLDRNTTATEIADRSCQSDTPTTTLAANDPNNTPNPAHSIIRTSSKRR